ncbi:hypothetical protein AB5J52_28115 [Streptomyces sp. R39]|uniref:Uncharacterized protein n=1 Tax=Streptomyces sp. R39 TaxID=3238631 RepID=A0AB39QQM7_9ACTN
MERVLTAAEQAGERRNPANTDAPVQLVVVLREDTSDEDDEDDDWS